MEKYQNAVESAWADVQRLEDEKNQVDKLKEKESEEEAQRLNGEKEDMEATLHEVASDLGRLALLYRTQGKAPHAVPLYMTAWPSTRRPWARPPGGGQGPRQPRQCLLRPEPAFGGGSLVSTGARD